MPQALVAAVLAMLAASLAAPSQAPVAAQHRYSQLDVLVVVLLDVTHDGVRTSLVGRNLTKVFVELERARLFYWRNSRMRLNLNLTYAVAATPVSFSGWWLPDYVVRRAVSSALERVGVRWGDFDGVVALWAAPNYREEPDPVGSVWGPGGTVYRYSSYQLDGAIAWLFVHEFHHQVDEFFDRSGHPQYPHADFPAQLAGRFGEHFDFNAHILRSWPEGLWLELRAPSTETPKVREAPDADGDGFPDYGPTLPCDEVRFGSSPNSADTDGDGLSDRGEFTAGIYSSADPLSTDTDGDGTPDGADEYPLYPVSTCIPRGRWATIAEGCVAHGAPVNYRLEASWNESGLALRLTVDPSEVESALVHLDLDGDGWWHGRGNYELVLRPSGERPLARAHALDCSEAERDPEARPLWDDDPGHGGRLVGPSDFRCSARDERVGGRLLRVVEVFVSESARTGFAPREGLEVGLRVEFRLRGGSWASVFERYDLAYLALVSEAASRAREAARRAEPPSAEGRAVYVTQYVEFLTKSEATVVVLVENAAFREVRGVVVKLGNRTLRLERLGPRSAAKLRYAVSLARSRVALLPRRARVEYSVGGRRYQLELPLPAVVVSVEEPPNLWAVFVRNVSTAAAVVAAVAAVLAPAYAWRRRRSARGPGPAQPGASTPSRRGTAASCTRAP